MFDNVIKEIDFVKPLRTNTNCVTRCFLPNCANRVRLIPVDSASFDTPSANERANVILSTGIETGDRAFA